MGANYYATNFDSTGSIFLGTYNGVVPIWAPPIPPIVLPTASSPAAVSPTVVATSTGVNPVETSYSLYGHIIPLTVFGFGRIGGEIISGPWISGGLASFIISFGVPADPSGTRDIREIAFDSEVVWSTSGASGVTTSGGGTFTTEAFTFNFKGGTLTQTVTSLETLHFATKANAYRPQMLLEFIDLPLSGTKFGKIPYVSAVIGDASGDDVNLGEAFERLANSPWCFGSTLGPANFETLGITDGLVDGGLIIAQDTEFLQLLQQFSRFYPNWDLLQTDKLRVVDRGAVVAADIVLDTTRLMDKVVVTRRGSDLIKKDLELSTIDNGADYTIVPSVAQRPRDPVAVTTSVGKDAAYLPAIYDAFTRMAVVTFARYYEENARKTISGTAMAYGLEIEPGALVSIDPGGDFGSEIFKVAETTRGVNNAVEFVARPILRCSIGTGEVGCSEAVSFLARTSGLDATHTSAYIALICGLVSDGVWDKFDALYVYATQNQTTALLNLKSTSFNSVAHGSPTFTADVGFTGVGSSSTVYIDTGFNPTVGSPEYTQNSAHISNWNLTPGTNQELAAIGSKAAGSNSLSYMVPQFGGDAIFYLNTAVAGLGQKITNSAGTDAHWIDNRLNSGVLSGWKNGVQIYGSVLAQISSPVLNQNFYALGMNNNGTPQGCDYQLASTSIGSHLSDADCINFYGRLRTYMTAVGLP
jgi:hypothetical protein